MIFYNLAQSRVPKAFGIAQKGFLQFSSKSGDFAQRAIRDGIIDKNSDAYKSWDQFHTVIGLADGAVAIYPLLSKVTFKGIASNYNKLKNKFSTLDNAFEGAPQAFKNNDRRTKWNEMKAIMQGTESQINNFISKINESQTLLNRYNGLSDDLKVIFNTDFKNIVTDTELFNLLKKQDSELFNGWFKFKRKYPLSQICN